MRRCDKPGAQLKGRQKYLMRDEIVRFLEGLDHAEVVAGKTGGSWRRLVQSVVPTIALHKPLPGNIVEMYAIDDVLHGGLEFIRHRIAHEREDANGITVAFQEAMGDCLGLYQDEASKPETVGL